MCISNQCIKVLGILHCKLLQFIAYCRIIIHIEGPQRLHLYKQHELGVYLGHCVKWLTSSLKFFILLATEWSLSSTNFLLRLE